MSKKRWLVILFAAIALAGCSGGVSSEAQQEAIDHAIKGLNRGWTGHTVEINNSSFSTFGISPNNNTCYRVDLSALIDGEPKDATFYGYAIKSESRRSGWVIQQVTDHIPDCR